MPGISLYISPFLFAAKLVPLAYGIQKLSILCTVEDEKVSIDDLSEKIQEIEDFVSITELFTKASCPLLLVS